MSLETLTEGVKSKVAGGGIDESVKFDLGEAGKIFVQGATVTNDDAEADCTVNITPDDLQELLDGELNPTAAFMSGKITVEGDMSVAMKLGTIV